MNKKIGKNGYSIVELLAVVAIIGIVAVISIVSVRALLNRAKKEYYKVQEDNMIIAGTNYFDSKDSIKPKSNGELSKVSLKDLINEKYIDEVVDYYKEACSYDNSYVQVFKYSNNYYYTPYLDCSPDYKTMIETYNTITDINITFNNSISDSKATINIKNTGRNNNYGISSYQYKVYKDSKLVYTSEVFDGKGKDTFNKTITISKYTPGKIKVVVSATDIYGVTTKKSATKDYLDNKAPDCKNIEDNKTWTNKDVTVRVLCDDSDGLGCARDYFESTFKDKEITTSSITIKDKAGNKKKCDVNIYLDKVSPKVVVKAYKSNSTHDGKYNNTVVGSLEVGGNVGDSTGELKNYTNLVNNWMNKSNYPYGVYYEITYSDYSGIKSAIVTWNDGSISDDNYKVLNTSNSKTPSSITNGYRFSLSGEGKRYAELVITDKASNKTTIKFDAFIDRTSPTVPTISMYKWNSNSEPTSTSGLEGYTNNTWSSKKVYTVASSTDSMSGIDYYQYTAGSSTGKKKTYSVTSDGVTKLIYIACDKAGNCSDNSSEKTIKVDTTPPNLTVKAYKRTSSGGKTGDVIKQVTTSSVASLNFTSWLNVNTYPYGIYYDISASDGQGLTKWQWYYNDSYLKNTSSNVNDLKNGATYDLSGKSTSQHVQISQSGWRKGAITFVDNAGNTAVVNVQAPFDDQAPSAPSGNAGSKNVSNAQVTATASGSNDSLSGVKQYLYCVKTNRDNPSNTDSCFKTSASYNRSCGTTNYVFAIAVDNSNNRSSVSYLGSVGDNADQWNWSACSATCDGGVKTATNSCELITGAKSEQCNTDPCVHTYTEYCGTNLISVNSSDVYLIQPNRCGGEAKWKCSSRNHSYCHSTAYIHYVVDNVTGEVYVKNSSVAGKSRLSNLKIDSSINDTSFCCPVAPPYPEYPD